MPHIDLLELPYFADIPIGDVVSLIDVMAPRQLAAGQALLAPEQAAPCALFILTQGEVQVHGATGAVHLQAPALIGAEDFFLQQAPSFAVTATRTASVFFLSQASFASLRQQQHPALVPFLLNLLRAVAAKSLAACRG